MFHPNHIREFWKESYSEIIDVRSEGEYADDHIPGAVNLPVLNNEERATVGTIYVQESPFKAKKTGTSFITKNISAHLKNHFYDKEKEYAPLVYCWRGGLRSYSMSEVLAQIGWRVTVLDGGYKTYRARVRELLDSLPSKFTFIVLCGLTGSGKTLLLKKLESLGSQVLDLEGLAGHRGSLLGELWEGHPVPQPSQKMFESCLIRKLQDFDPRRPVWVESESNRIGSIHLVLPLWEAMRKGVTAEICVPLEKRTDFLLREYGHFASNPEYLMGLLPRLIPLCGHKNVDRWRGLFTRGDIRTMVTELLTCHYDRLYGRSMIKTFNKPIVSVSSEDLSDLNLLAATERLQVLEMSVGTTGPDGLSLQGDSDGINAF